MMLTVSCSIESIYFMLIFSILACAEVPTDGYLFRQGLVDFYLPVQELVEAPIVREVEGVASRVGHERSGGKFFLFLGLICADFTCYLVVVPSLSDVMSFAVIAELSLCQILANNRLLYFVWDRCPQDNSWTYDFADFGMFYWFLYSDFLTELIVRSSERSAAHDGQLLYFQV